MFRFRILKFLITISQKANNSNMFSDKNRLTEMEPSLMQHYN